MIFYCLSPARGKRLVVSAPSAFDARALARVEMYADDAKTFRGAAPDDLRVEELWGVEPDAQLAWHGSDAGEHPNRHMQVRYRTGKRWSPWTLLDGRAPDRGAR